MSEQMDQIAVLVEALKETDRRVWEHHELGHIMKQANLRLSSCELCGKEASPTIFERNQKLIDSTEQAAADWRAEVVADATEKERVRIEAFMDEVIEYLSGEKDVDWSEGIAKAAQPFRDLMNRERARGEAEAAALRGTSQPEPVETKIDQLLRDAQEQVRPIIARETGRCPKCQRETVFCKCTAKGPVAATPEPVKVPEGITDDLLDLLNDLSEFLKNYEDAESDTERGGYIPNKAMRLRMSVEEQIAALNAAGGTQ